MTFKQKIASMFYRAGDRMQGYDAAESTRHRNVLRGGRNFARSEDQLIGSWDRERIRQRCLDLRRNNAVVAGVVERMAANVVGAGIAPQAKTSDPKWNDAAEAYWGEWSKVCDVRQRATMRDLQRLVVQSRMIMGDGGFIVTSGGQLQPIESERIKTPDYEKENAAITEGVKIDQNTGIAVGYYIFQRDKDGKIDTSSKDFDYVPRENFIFFHRPIRFDQLRGVPDLAPVCNALQDCRELNDATIQKAKLDALNAWFVQTQGTLGPGNMGPRGRTVDVDATQLEKVESGMIHYGRPGESMTSLKSNTPNAEYMEFYRLQLRLIGSALGLPLEFLLLDFSQGSYSSSRAALLQTYRTFSDWQEWLTTQMLQRVWNWRIAKAIKAGMLPPAPLDERGVSQWYRVHWSYPEFGWVDPQNEATASLLEYNMGTNTITAIARKKGRDAEDVLAEKGNDIATAIRIAAEINAATPGANLTWRDLIQTGIPGQTAPSKEKPAGDTMPAKDGDDEIE